MFAPSAISCHDPLVIRARSPYLLIRRLSCIPPGIHRCRQARRILHPIRARTSDAAIQVMLTMIAKAIAKQVIAATNIASGRGSACVSGNVLSRPMPTAAKIPAKVAAIAMAANRSQHPLAGQDAALGPPQKSRQRVKSPGFEGALTWLLAPNRDNLSRLRRRCGDHRVPPASSSADHEDR